MTRSVASRRVIDSHLHLWDLDVSKYAWNGPQLGALNANFTPEMAWSELSTAGVEGAVLVQADDTAEDTRFMLDAAASNRWVLGVVGWVPLEQPAAAEQALDELLDHPVFCGVRHLLHNDPRDDYLALSSVRKSASLLAARGLALDIPDAWPRHLKSTADLAAALPDLTVVVDHMGKPPRDDDHAFAQWHDAIKQVARQPNTVAKFSGLRMAGAEFTTEALRATWEIALELFGPDRLMYGGDWPMTVPDGGYQSTFEVQLELIEQLTQPEQHQLLAGTATRVYQLPTHRTLAADQQ